MSDYTRRAIPIAEAQRLIAAHARPLRTERVPLLAAFGRRLAEPLVADRPVPAFARSGMDGYAVRAADLAEASPARPARLAVAQATVASGGTAPPQPVSPGEAARIMTGAPLPAGADAVVMLESVREEATGALRQAVFARPVAAGLNVTPVGGEIAPGAAVLAPGVRIGPGAAALLASFGRTEPLTYARPRVAIVTTGSEVIAPEETPGYGQIRNSNLAMLRGLAEDAGAEVVFAAHADDDEERIARAIRIAFEEAGADAVLTSGGVSVGDFDLTGRLLGREGRTLLFNKISMRPGSVTSAAVQDGKPLFGLSGNPSACYVGFALLVRPALARMGGHPEFGLPSYSAYLGEDYPKGGAFPRYLRGRTSVERAVVRVTPCSGNRSSDILSIQEADCLIVIPPCPRGLPAGTLVEAIPLASRGDGYRGGERT
ncbi:molybdopterin molybdotransferase MoeA [Cohnella nanjingensis]|uniref:Molybdopterin molybdenumtransferase n=1 Tax=Cohnella nanjingensis TaxID=1387779 RepID=A0A7X0RNV9_9BACL|nr:gephyrin-like molybdotransferase Glp [Cohnella nanjingensis]MBB6669796.1 molybdopterin molybdotransferase MoeA [Cohnella nanjingensis]